VRAPAYVTAYVTCWAGPCYAEALVASSDTAALDTVVFTSTAEVEVLLRGLDAAWFLTLSPR
jgi:uroporphyrinogen-III synthase